jgi:hypothetical protein
MAFALLGACASDPAPAYLPSDAQFVRPDIDQCRATYPDPPQLYYCCHVLWLGADGTASVSSGEEGFPGTYTLSGPYAKGEIFKQPFTFDLTTGAGTGYQVDGAWMADTGDRASLVCH